MKAHRINNAKTLVVVTSLMLSLGASGTLGNTGLTPTERDGGAIVGGVGVTVGHGVGNRSGQNTCENTLNGQGTNHVYQLGQHTIGGLGSVCTPHNGSNFVSGGGVQGLGGGIANGTHTPGPEGPIPGHDRGGFATGGTHLI